MHNASQNTVLASMRSRSAAAASSEGSPLPRLKCSRAPSKHEKAGLFSASNPLDPRINLMVWPFFQTRAMPGPQEALRSVPGSMRVSTRRTPGGSLCSRNAWVCGGVKISP
ncbi:MAG: hypothetical protein MUF04_08670, partial [Akkermansiaceae bacterium]|nr:hypothetical protein [Akkermansiaceae bacterium]